MDEAGSAGLVFVTAWLALVNAAEVSQRDTVLIIGASGGVGTAAVQIAKTCGAKVIGAVRSDQEVSHARENGADEVINTGGQNLAQALATITQNHGADVVFDTSGGMFAESVEAAAPKGRVCVISAPGDGKVTFNLRSLYRKELRVAGVDTRQLDAVACARLLEQMRPSFESGKFRMSPGQAFGLADASEAYEQAAGGKGRVYFRPNDR
jgi:NADPH:quinone reductase-like Zn-dependent oxidoreductase